jgi:hypothetical protein
MRLLLHCLEKLPQGVLGRGGRRFNSALRRAFLAQVELRHRALHDLRKVHYSITFPASVAHH